MQKLVVTADVHGSYSTWLTIKDMLNPGDALAVAGDFFGTRYPSYKYSDYQPERILEELSEFQNPFYFVYGNCDLSSFSPGYQDSLIFDFIGWKIFLHHGERFVNQITSDILSSDVNLVIQGHTHVFALEKINYSKNHKEQNQQSKGHNIQKQNNQRQMIFLNPGSLSEPRTSFYTYAVVDSNAINIIDIKTSTSLKTISII